MEIKENFYWRIKKLNASTYLTLLSIIQGVSLSFFAFYFIANFSDYHASSWVISLTTFVLIILTWFEYVVGITVFEWIHGFADTMIPFFMFGAEIALVCNMGTDLKFWFVSMSIFCLLALLAFINMYRKAGLEPEHSELLNHIKTEISFTKIYLILSSVSFLAFFVVVNECNVFTLSLVSFLFVFVFSVFANMYWSKVVKYAKQLNAQQIN